MTLYYLGETVVYNFEVAALINQDVLQLEIPVHNSFAVQFADCQNDLHCVELDCALLKALLSLENFVELATLNERHHEVEARLRLEQELHAYEKGVICRKQNLFFKHCRLNLICLYQYILPDNFHGVLLPRRLQLA